MAKDFRADRIRIKAIVGTGSISNTKPHLGLLVYSSSIASDWRGNVTDSAILTNVGDDVWMFVSGSRNTGLTRDDGSSVLFGGDVVVSGTLWAERSIVEVSDSVVGNFRAPNKIIQGFTTDPSTGNALFLADPFTSTGGSNGAGTISFKVVDGVAGAYDYPTTTNKDVFFHVSGSRGVKGTDDRGLALFDGDVFISGNLELSPESAFSLAGDFSIGGDLTVGGNDILGSAGNALNFGTVDPDVTIIRGLKIGNDALTGSDDTVFLVHSGSGDVGVEGSLQVSGKLVKDHEARTVLRFADSYAALYGQLAITGSGGGAAAAELQVFGDNNPANISLTNNTPATTAGEYLGGIRFFSDDGTWPSRTPGAYIYSKATADWDIGSGGSVADTAIELWTRGTSDASPTRRLAIENNPNVSDRIQLTVSGNLKLADGTSPGGGGNFNSSVLSPDDVAAFSVLNGGTVRFFQGVNVDNDLYVGGNLDVNGTLTTIDTTNLRVSDALIEVASAGGGGSNNTNGGIAVASGSSIDDVSLVFGKGNSDNTWRAGRKDTVGGTISDVSDSVLIDIEAAGLQVNGGYITGSAGLDATLHLTASSPAGGILLSSNDGVSIDSELLLPSSALIKAGGEAFIRRESGNSTRISNPDGLLRLWNLDRGLSTPLAPTYNTRIELGTGATKIANEALGSDLENGFRLLMSSSGGEVQLYADASGGYENILGGLRVILSASSAETEGGPNIILSSSQEYNGGLGNGFEGFIAIGSTQAEVDRDFTLSRHRDVRTLLSGAVGTAGSTTRGVTLVAGDMVVSGNTDFKGSVAIGAISTANLTLTSVSSNEPYLRFRDSSVQINRRSSDDAMVFTDGDLGTTKTLRDLASLSVTDNTDVFTVSGGEPSYIKTTGSFSFDTDDQYTTAVNGGNSDTYFYVSGSIGSSVQSWKPSLNGERGTAVFGGDVHVSGSIYTDNPLFFTTLGTAYKTPDTAYPTPFASLTAGAGAVIDTDNSGIPVQIRNPGAGSNDSSAKLLTLTGSLGFEYSGAGSNTRLHMQSDNAFEFHNSAGEVFRMTAGSSGTNLRLNNNNQVNFEDDSRFVYGLTQDSVKKLSLRNNNAGGTIQVSTNSGRMEVTGSLYPGADNTYDLGSNDYRWANIYTGDLHLQNERGDWTVIEEEDYLTLRNNKNGKRYKLLMELIDEE